ncbi:MAG: hypothetical protein ABI199_03040 [Bacteroidia bacterium]
MCDLLCKDRFEKIIFQSAFAKTTYLLAEENIDPAKLEKAVKLGINIISEDDFLKMIE